jgi:hypothetical protein
MNSGAWLALLVWVAVPILAGYMLLGLPKHLDKPSQRKWAKAGGLGVLMAPWIISSGVKWYYDQEVRELCAKDGGVRVYETMKLPAPQYEELKRLNFILSGKLHRSIIDEFYLKTEHQFLKEGNPKILRSHAWIMRRSDNKILGESVHYARSGGELPGPWHGSSFHCPEISRGNPSLETSVFIKGDD